MAFVVSLMTSRRHCSHSLSDVTLATKRGRLATGSSRPFLPALPHVSGVGRPAHARARRGTATCSLAIDATKRHAITRSGARKQAHARTRRHVHTYEHTRRATAARDACAPQHSETHNNQRLAYVPPSVEHRVGLFFIARHLHVQQTTKRTTNQQQTNNKRTKARDKTPATKESAVVGWFNSTRNTTTTIGHNERATTNKRTTTRAGHTLSEFFARACAHSHLSRVQTWR